MIVKTRTFLCVAMPLMAFATMASAQTLDLTTAARSALEKDPEYLSQVAGAKASAEAAPQALAQMLPQASVNVGFFNNSLQTSNKLTSRLDEYPSSSAAVSLRQPIFRPVLFANWRQGQATKRRSELLVDKAQQGLLKKVASSYFDVLLADKWLHALEAQYSAIESQKAAAQALFRRGFGVRTDVDDASARLAMLSAKIIAARQRISSTRDTLQSSTTAEFDTVLPIREDLVFAIQKDMLPAQQWVDFALENNPDLRILNENVRIAQREVDKAMFSMSPTVDLFVQRSISKSDNITNPGVKYENSQYGVQIVMPLSQGGYNASRIRQTRASLTEARQRLEFQRRQVELEVKSQYHALTEGVARVEAMQLAVNSASQALLSNEKGYLAGTRSRLDVLNAVEAKSTADYQFYADKLSVVAAFIRLKAAAGILSLEDIGYVNSYLGKSS